MLAYARWIALSCLFELSFGIISAGPMARAQEPEGRKYAILVGVREYDRNQLRSLPYPEHDVVELADVLLRSGFRRVVLLTQTEGAKTQRLLPLAKNVRNSLAGLLEDRTKDDLVLVAFAGHGVQFKGEKESYFCPMDAVLTDRSSLVSLSDVYKQLEQSKAGTKLLIVDACRNDPLSGNARARAEVELDSVTRPQLPDPPGGVAALFSCSAGQRAFEDESLKHGVFFHHVIKGLKGDAKLGRKDEVTWDSLVAYVKAEVPDTVKDLFGDTYRQIPEHKGTLRGAATLIVFSRPNLPPSATPVVSPVPSSASVPSSAPSRVPSLQMFHLDNPSGVCVHPTTGHIFITSRQGVFRFVFEPFKGKKSYLEVEGFPTDIYGKGPMYNIGPLGCTLWGTDRLIVPDGSRADGEELIRIYKIEDAVPGKPRKEDDAEFTLGPIKGTAFERGEGNFYQAVVWNDAIYVTSNGDDTKGWVVVSKITDGKPGELTPTIATKEFTEVDAPTAITVSPDKSTLVIGQMGEVNLPGDSLLTFYDKDGKLVKKLKTGLHDITGLAYSPSGKLYATDFAWAEEIKTEGGLFELVIEGEEVKPKKIIGLDRPTALAFNKEGALYITVFGTGKDTGDKPTGGLLRLEPGL